LDPTCVIIIEAVFKNPDDSKRQAMRDGALKFIKALTRWDALTAMALVAALYFIFGV
jgi:hypothetical protein